MLHVLVHMIGQDSALLYCSTVVLATMAFNCEMTHRGAQLTQTCLCICICTLVFLYSVFVHYCIVRLWWVSIVGREAQAVDHWHASRPFQFPEKSHSAEKDFRGKTGFPWTKNHRHVKKEFLSDRIFLSNLCHCSKDSKYRNLF